MKKILFSMFFALIAVNPAHAESASDDAVTQLLVLQGIDKSAALVFAQLDELTTATVDQMTQGHWFQSDAEKAAVRMFQEKSLAVKAELEDRLSFEKLKPVYIKIYRDHFNKEEIDQLIALYQTPAGQLLATKMPVASQEASNVLQQNVTPMFARMRQAAAEMKQQIDAARAK